MFLKNFPGRHVNIRQVSEPAEYLRVTSIDIPIDMYCQKLYLSVSSDKTMEEEVINIKFQVEGITCSGCAMDMENILLDTDGVEDASVNFTDGIIAITFNPGVIDEKNLTTRVRKLGFKIEKM